MTAAAQTAVFNTPELFEHIISFLPHSDTLKVQRVSQQWKNAIRSSPSIQTKLWLRPQNPAAIPPVAFTNESTFAQSVGWGRRTLPIYSRRVLLNPICLADKMGSVQFCKTFSPFWLFETASGSFLHTETISIFFFEEHGQHPYQPVDVSRGNWKNMYLTDPPITTCIIHLRHGSSFAGNDPHAYAPVAIRDHGGPDSRYIVRHDRGRFCSKCKWRIGVQICACGHS